MTNIERFFWRPGDIVIEKDSKYAPDQPRDDHGRFGFGTSVDDPVAKSLRVVEKELVAGTTESLAVLDPKTGDRMFTLTDHARGRVSIAEGYYAQMQGCILTHNHPATGGPFSVADLVTAVRGNLAELRAVTDDHKIYSLKAPEGGWDKMKVGTSLSAWGPITTMVEAARSDFEKDHNLPKFFDNVYTVNKKFADSMGATLTVTEHKFPVSPIAVNPATWTPAPRPSWADAKSAKDSGIDDTILDPNATVEEWRRSLGLDNGLDNDPDHWSEDDDEEERSAPLAGAKYSADQPRDWHGRFGSGSAETEGSGGLPFNAHGDQYFHALNAKGQADVVARSEKFGVTPDAITKELESRLRNPDGTPKTELLEQGAKWYPEAHQLVVRLAETTADLPHPVDPGVAATVLAELSPQTPWQTNAEVAARLCQWHAAGNADGFSREEAAAAFKAQWKEEGWGGQTKGSGYTENAKLAMMNGQVMNALDVLGGRVDIDDALSSPKQRSFANNIMLPGRTDDVTVDIMMQKAMTWAATGPLPKDKDMAIAMGLPKNHTVATFMDGTVNAKAGAGYVTVAAGTRVAAKNLGVSPDVAQASYWLVVQNLEPPGWPASPNKVRMKMPLVTSLLGHPFVGTEG